MRSMNKEVGNLGEAIAVEYLISVGYEILERNFRCKIGEVDIIAKDGIYLTFIEVKTRRVLDYGEPCESVTASKVKKIVKCSQYFTLINQIKNISFRFDVVEVILDRNMNYKGIKLIKNAFQT